MIALAVAADVVPALSGLQLGIPHAAIATLGVVLFIGLGFIARPRMSTLWWSFAFLLTMVASFGYLAALVNESEQLRRASLGLMMGAPALIWAGLRAYRGVRSFAWVGLVVSALSIAALLAPGDTEWYVPVYRVVFFVCSAFGAAFVWEWTRMVDRRERILIPVVILSGLFTVAGLATLVGGFFAGSTSTDSLAATRVFSSVGMLIFMVCIMVSLLPLVTPGSRTTGAGAAADHWQRFRATATGRLDRARESGDTGWALLRIELDDAEDLEEAGGISVFYRLVRDMTARVRSVFPADADVSAAPDGTILVLVARPEAVVRELVRQTLREISVRDPAAPVTVTPSASIGWAGVQMSGYDLDTLLSVTAEAAATARAKGGDRWERVSA